ncbi:MAG: phosphate transport system regulatory protein PhoU [Tenericutes bacterium HGW-Tenericutes-1]|jgi:phosphate transport system protein|nr:MAG: phosphate transport system regulatory protein PhoU [Tenericutes bacterium HGW-Tenericutes-1]
MTYRVQFEKELEDLKIDLIKMGDEVISNIKDGLKSFLTMDGELAQATIKKDKIVNDYEIIIEKKCLQIILKEQPVAKDLRLITAVLKMITDLERIGDHAADISKMTIFMQENTKPYTVKQMALMTEASQKMIKKALDSFVTRNLELAYEVINDDDEVDEYFLQVKKIVAQAIRNNEIDADYALYLMMVAKYLERISDHAVNIGEWVVFSILGEHKHDVIF